MAIENLKNVESEVSRINGQLYQTFIIKDDDGNEVQRINFPLKVEIRLHDILEIVVGASILAVPVAFTEEVWDMGDDLSWLSVVLLCATSLVFMGGFIYYTAYLKKLGMYRKEYFLRLISTFLISIVIVGYLLTIVDKCPWVTDFDLALKRTLIGAFPASMSATVTDNLGSGS